MDLMTVSELYAYGEELLRIWAAPQVEGAWRVEYNRRMRTRAGVAYLEALRVELNPRLLKTYPDRVRECLCHELAHLVVHRLYGRRARAHGKEWAALMRAAGFEPRRTHDFDVRPFRQKRPRYLYLHECVRCRRGWFARKVRRDLSCPHCGPGEVRVLRGPDDAKGRERLLEASAAEG